MTEDEWKMLNNLIAYHERIAVRAKIFETVSIQTLEENTVRYLKVLRDIKMKEQR